MADLENDGEDLNQNHRRVLQSAFAYIDGLLNEIETITGHSGQVFPRYISDLSPAQHKVILDYIAQIRSQIRGALQTLTIDIPVPDINSSHAIQTTLTMAQVALQEIGPTYLRGYGTLGSPDTIEWLAADLVRSFRRMSAVISNNPATNLEHRIHQIETPSVELSDLRKLERIIAQRGLVEFRGNLQALLEQMESRTYEIAVFGRVSSGKSSMLNAILGQDVLPVGVTPVTAVATRLVWGCEARIQITYRSGRGDNVALADIADFVSETGNPDNRKQVARVTVAVPAENLRDGIVFVDTPGIGSLAASGARETYAYLPRCDLGILLIDASGAPTHEDLDILRQLHGSGIPSLVVISKSDLLSVTDLDRMREYLHSSIHEQMGIDISVHAVSCTGNAGHPVLDWFARELAPRCAQARQMAAISLGTKLQTLRKNVVIALQSMLEAGNRRHDSDQARNIPNLQLLALEAEGVLHRVEESCIELADLSQYARGMAVRAMVQSLLLKKRQAACKPEVMEQAFIQAVFSTADYVRAPLRQDLLDARDRLRKILSEMAASFSFIAIRPKDIGLDLLTLPAVQAPTQHLNIHLRWPPWLSWFPAALTRSLNHQIQTGVGTPLEAAFQSLGRDLRAWSVQAIARLGEQFAAQAEPLRAHARRLLQFQQSTADAQEVANDLHDLSGPADVTGHRSP